MKLKCGLLGQKLGHSYSPLIHSALSSAYSYELFEIEPDELATFIEKKEFHGLNVTIPYKTMVIPYCTKLSALASAIGSVNTILKQEDGILYGDNTDAAGFLAMIKGCGAIVKDKKILILGSGGSSLTVKAVLKSQSAAEIITVSRNGEDTYENLQRHYNAHIIVNTTPVGMYPDTGKTLIELSKFPQMEAVLDLVYNPFRTRLLMDAESLDIAHISGLSMLVSQAKRSAELFSGKAISSEKEADILALLQKQMENIILIGMPGCGKTTVGQALAKIMGRPFYDSDNLLETEAKMTIPEIFEKEGVDGFREREIKVLEKLGKESGLIIATGGGCITREENYAHLHQNGRIIFLERSIDLLERKGRPLSTNIDLNEMYIERLPLYRRFADFTIKNNSAAQTIAESISSTLAKP